MKLSYVMLGVSSMEKSVPFYRDLLGLKIVGQVEGEFVFFDAGGSAQLALRMFPDSGNPGDTEFVFEVRNIHKTYEELTRKGIVFRVAPRAVTGNETSDLYAADFQDPDGHVLSITEWVPKRGSMETPADGA